MYPQEETVILMTNNAIIQVENLRKVYGSVVAIDDISFEVAQGEIFGMVGPNGAGKTTTIECIEGLRSLTKGLIRVLGLDPRKEKYALLPRIGIQLQQAALQDRIKVWEALDLYTSLYRRTADWRKLLEQMGLAEKRKAPFAKLSGGQKQRLFIALALLNDPEVVFLDELTTGLDPQARRTMWDMVREIRDRGKTIFLITHFMEEAERLCDRVVIVDHGRIIALDTPEKLIDNLGAENRVVFTTDGKPNLERLKVLPGVSHVDVIGGRVIVAGSGETLLSGVVNVLSSNGFRYHDVHTEQPTLDDVFLKLTGRAIRD
jgi:ABC-2 type transport system ATP-binding protein